MPQQVQNLPAMRETQEMRIRSRVRKIPGRRKWQPTPVFLPGKSHGQRSLLGCGPKDCKELDMTEQLSAYTLWCTCILQCVYVCIYTFCLRDTALS